MALRLPKRKRTRSPRDAKIGVVPGNARAFIVSRLKSVISLGSGRLVPGTSFHSLNMKA
jgi:hypothetical protein